eukprot:COSAG04_NODE_504_length_13347_cov_231.910251_4_plen_251_part_00
MPAISWLYRCHLEKNATQMPAMIVQSCWHSRKNATQMPAVSVAAYPRAAPAGWAPPTHRSPAGQKDRCVRVFWFGSGIFCWIRAKTSSGQTHQRGFTNINHGAYMHGWSVGVLGEGVRTGVLERSHASGSSESVSSMSWRAARSFACAPHRGHGGVKALRRDDGNDNAHAAHDVHGGGDENDHHHGGGGDRKRATKPSTIRPQRSSPQKRSQVAHLPRLLFLPLIRPLRRQLVDLLPGDYLRLFARLAVG